MQAIALGTVVLFVTGFADDIWHLNFKTRFVIQALVAVSMVFLGGVELVSLGELLPGMDINLGALGIPFTIFATIGLINALNMIDGIDGLACFPSSVGLCRTGGVALTTIPRIIIAVMGGVSGFLLFQLRYPSNGRRVFLATTRMLFGFVFA
jgi:UDP-N-acetylmuramyl pentapeptide phosphotransferase/UDP-N-acetylglucosamine-1-phosphate transferase